jgi:hypothetical protein
VVEVLGAVARGFDHQHAAVGGVANGVVVVGPPLDGDEALLPASARFCAASTMAPALPVPPKTDTADTVAAGAMPVTPKPLRSPPMIPMTAVPWLRQSRERAGSPPTTPPLFSLRSSWVKRHAPSMSMTPTPAPSPPGCAHDARASTPTGAASR